jgi:hypothetical protein
MLVPLDVATHLEPAVEPAMVMEQQAKVIVDDVAARGDVTGSEMIARKGAGSFDEQLHDGGMVAGLERIGRAVPAELLENTFVAQHSLRRL